MVATFRDAVGYQYQKVFARKWLAANGIIRIIEDTENRTCRNEMGGPVRVRRAAAAGHIR
jgi:hypothetical protein